MAMGQVSVEDLGCVRSGVAANTFFGAFACYRRFLDQSVTTMNISAVGDIEYLARERQGFLIIDYKSLIRLLVFAIQHSFGDLHAAHIIS